MKYIDIDNSAFASGINNIVEPILAVSKYPLHLRRTFVLLFPLSIPLWILVFGVAMAIFIIYAIGASFINFLILIWGGNKDE